MTVFLSCRGSRMSGEKPERRENGMQMIVAVDENWAIGLNGGLLVRIPGDM